MDVEWGRGLDDWCDGSFYVCLSVSKKITIIIAIVTMIIIIHARHLQVI